MTNTLTPIERKAILKRHRWNVNALRRELEMRGFKYSSMALHHWIKNTARLSDDSTKIALADILSRELSEENITIDQLFNT